MSWRETECPNFEQCGGELQFDEETVDAYIGTRSYAVLVGQTCTCALSDAERERQEEIATEALNDPESWAEAVLDE